MLPETRTLPPVSLLLRNCCPLARSLSFRNGTLRLGHHGTQLWARLWLGGDLVRPHRCTLRVLLSFLPIRKPPTNMASPPSGNHHEQPRPPQCPSLDPRSLNLFLTPRVQALLPAPRRPLCPPRVHRSTRPRCERVTMELHGPDIWTTWPHGDVTSGVCPQMFTLLLRPLLSSSERDDGLVLCSDAGPRLFPRGC